MGPDRVNERYEGCAFQNEAAEIDLERGCVCMSTEQRVKRGDAELQRGYSIGYVFHDIVIRVGTKWLAPIRRFS